MQACCEEGEVEVEVLRREHPFVVDRDGNAEAVPQPNKHSVDQHVPRNTLRGQFLFRHIPPIFAAAFARFPFASEASVKLRTPFLVPSPFFPLGMRESGLFIVV